MTAPAGESGAEEGAEQGGNQQGNPQQGNANRGDDFTPITSQEQFDKAFGQRWSREQAKIHDQYKGFDDLKAKASEFDKLQAANQTESERLQSERDAALQAAQQEADRANKAELAALRQKVAIEQGLSPKFAAKLSGTTEEELIADAQETFGDFINTAPPSFDHGPRQQSAPQSMNDLIFGAAKRR